MEPASKRLKPDRRTCPHCNQSVSFKTFAIHKRLYYDTLHGRWLKSRRLLDALGDDSNPHSKSSGNSDSEPSSIEFESDVCDRSNNDSPEFSSNEVFSDDESGSSSIDVDGTCLPIFVRVKLVYCYGAYWTG